MTMLFKDRKEAGRRLADRLKDDKGSDPIVLALPRGGVVVGYEVAMALEAPLDVIVVRKLGVPGRPELGIGAVAPDGIWIVNEQMVRLLGLTEEDVIEVAAKEEREMERRLRRYRGTARMPDLRRRTVILVDDGLATGATAQAAIEFIRRLNQKAFDQLDVEKRLEIIPGATHLFEEQGALEAVAGLAADWFVRHLGNQVQARAA